jgi:hypothetical protein
MLVSIDRLNLSNFVTFTGSDFQPCLASRFLLGVCQQFLLEDIELSTCFERLLPNENVLCRQTDIAYIRKSESEILGSRYSWAHGDVRPWGQELPVQCQGCGRIRNWSGTKSGGKYVFDCKTQSCETKLVFSPPERMKWIGKSASGGRWFYLDIKNLSD